MIVTYFTPLSLFVTCVIIMHNIISYFFVSVQNNKNQNENQNIMKINRFKANFHNFDIPNHIVLSFCS